MVHSDRSIVVIPAPYQVRGKLQQESSFLDPCFDRDKPGFPFSRLRAEALRRASTGTTKSRIDSKWKWWGYGRTTLYEVWKEVPIRRVNLCGSD